MTVSGAAWLEQWPRPRAWRLLRPPWGRFPPRLRPPVLRVSWAVEPRGRASLAQARARQWAGPPAGDRSRWGMLLPAVTALAMDSHSSRWSLAAVVAASAGLGCSMMTAVAGCRPAWPCLQAPYWVEPGLSGSIEAVAPSRAAAAPETGWCSAGRAAVAKETKPPSILCLRCWQVGAAFS